ncbi:hypothetical protein MPTK1_1g07220 [Marchantia polymorpha subsp. ruderalis]|uniref:non-specific serine/threonine protein kinase n=2 Tax=Marchantia polymorpha TaxID=3197 RepID=A0AAF6AMH1_MARPO|nr:hypothetical protein MARPO_0043s0115 [Marchantia polymorpha]BBM97641.1 hypothetical protein Mp_1g07220 [Marchantia polymorpha subsp. ruderalis]|eukprot:PTQ39883.1 hypothetical protein MARPO_0043s0115 [Marchantia polymorpha]
MWARRWSSVLLFIVFFCWRSLQARAQPGFHSVDCGGGSNYTDDLGIAWSADEYYIGTGVDTVIDLSEANLGPDAAQNGPKLQTLRYFPGPADKSCYTFKVSTSIPHLIRFMFLGGNFTSGLTQPASFSVSIATLHLLDIQVSDPWTPIIREVTFVPITENFAICFQRGPSHVPFVSSLELRPLPISYYQLSIESIVLTNIVRIDCGRKSGSPVIRYPDDLQDRLWASDPKNLSIKSIANNNAIIDNRLYYDTEAPISVLQSAWSDSRITLLQEYDPSQTTSAVQLYYILLYFVEIAETNSTDVREVMVYLDKDPLKVNPLRVNRSTYSTFQFGLPLLLQATQALTINLTIVPSEDSTLGAILNAVEIYSLINFTYDQVTSTVDVTTIEAIKLKLNLTQYEGDPCLPWAYNWLGCSDPAVTGTSSVTQLNLSNMSLSGPILPEIVKLSELTDVALDNNNLTGTIPDLKSLTKLQTLRLQNNSLGGKIPDTLGLIPNLTILNLDNNLFEGGLPPRLQDKIDFGVLALSVVNNPYLCFGGNLCLQPGSPVPSSAAVSDKGSSKIGIIVGAIAGAVVVVLLLMLFVCRKCLKDSHPKNWGLPLLAKVNQPTSFTWAEVTTITHDFVKVLGRGGYGLVYSGTLANGEHVAVKVNKENTRNSRDQFLNEVSLLSRIHHRHIVDFIGFCNEGNHEVLIYAFMAEGTLEEHIRGDGEQSSSRAPLDWKKRLNIILDASKGLEYLHHSCSPPIIHRDVKTANILLTETLIGKVSDFGISKPTREEDRNVGVMTAVKGTFGYLDPQYFQDGLLNQKSDVYSFGVVLLEVITGKSPRTIQFPNSTALNLKEWVEISMRSDDIESITDPKLGRDFDRESVWKVAELALKSLIEVRDKRPEMSRVVEDLTHALEIENRRTSTGTSTDAGAPVPPSGPRGFSSRSSSGSVATFSTYSIAAR